MSRKSPVTQDEMDDCYQGGTVPNPKAPPMQGESELEAMARELMLDLDVDIATTPGALPYDEAEPRILKALTAAEARGYARGLSEFKAWLRSRDYADADSEVDAFLERNGIELKPIKDHL